MELRLKVVGETVPLLVFFSKAMRRGTFQYQNLEALRAERYGREFAGNIIKCLFLNEGKCLTFE